LCRLQLERRTTAGESGDSALREVLEILARLREEDSEFEAEAALSFARPPYELAADHPLPRMLIEAVAALGRPTAVSSMSFWTDAAVLGSAGIPSVLFGPGGAGLHSRDEYVTTGDVEICRDALYRLVREWC
jgi:acetylornithine deacetylase